MHWEKLTASVFCLGSSEPSPPICEGYWVFNNVLNLKDTESLLKIIWHFNMDINLVMNTKQHACDGEYFVIHTIMR